MSFPLPTSLFHFISVAIGMWRSGWNVPSLSEIAKYHETNEKLFFSSLLGFIVLQNHYKLPTCWVECIFKSKRQKVSTHEWPACPKHWTVFFLDSDSFMIFRVLTVDSGVFLLWLSRALVTEGAWMQSH